MRRHVAKLVLLAFVLSLGMLTLVSEVFASCPVTVLPTDLSTSGNGRAPSVRFRYIRTIYLITAAELAANGLTSGASPSGIGWTYQAAPGNAGSGSLVVYLQNTADTTNLKSTTWSTAIGGMTTVHNAVTALPATAGSFNIAFSGGSPFTYTGGGLYVAFDWVYATGTLSTTAVTYCNTALTGGLNGAQSTTTQPTTTVASNFRPETILTAPVAGNDAGVDFVITTGAVPRDLIAPLAQTIQATVSNYGDVALTNLPVTLNIAGANTFANTQTVATLAPCGGFSTVTFAPFTPTTIGSNTATVTVPSDDVSANNSLSRPLDVTVNRYSYKHAGTVPSGGAGFTGGTGEFVAKFSTNASTQIDSVAVEFFSAAASTYKIVIRGDDGVGAPGAAIYLDASDRAVTAGSTTVRLPSPVAVGPGPYFVGVRQTSTTNAGYSFDYEFPIRSGTFFYSTTPDVGPWTDFSPSTFFQLNVGTNLGACLVPLTVDVTQNGTTTACAGGSILFTANATGGTGSYTYQWTENGIDIPLATSSTYSATKAGAGSFTYNCKVTDDAGCTDVVDGASSTGTWLANGAACDDGNSCTANDACSGGACLGTPLSVPGEVTGLNFQPDKQTLVWNSVAGAGPGTVHQVPRGLVSQLPVGSGASEICLATTASATANDGTAPSVGTGFWYLVRGKNSCGTGSYGQASNGNPRVTSICP